MSPIDDSMECYTFTGINDTKDLKYAYKRSKKLVKLSEY